MRRPFAILLLNPHNDADEACAGYKKLLELGAKYNLGLFTETAVRAKSEPVMINGDLTNVNPATVFLVAGNPSPALLESAMDRLYERELDAMIVLDALTNAKELHPTLMHLHEAPTQMTKTGALSGVIKAKRHMIYKYPKADSTTTIFVIVDWYTNNPLVLTIERDHPPFKDQESGPGGFLNVMLETIYGCAERETYEETSVRAKGVELIDVRSDPDRDPREHVVDHGFAWFVPRAQRNKVVASAKAADDAKPGSAHFRPLQPLRGRKLAFDHSDLLTATVKRMRAKKRDFLRRSRAARRR